MADVLEKQLAAIRETADPTRTSTHDGPETG